MSSHVLFLLGFGLILAGVIVLLAAALLSAKGEAKVAVGGFIGPLPFGFANDPRLLWLVLAIAVAMVFIFLFSKLLV